MPNGFATSGMTYREVERGGVYLPVVEAHCSYKKPAFYDDLLTIATAFRFSGPARLRFDYEILRDGEILAVGYTVHACVNRDRKVLKPPGLPQNRARIPARCRYRQDGDEEAVQESNRIFHHEVTRNTRNTRMSQKRLFRADKTRFKQKMIIFPAIDLKDGLCVRLMQGDPERVTVYGKDPVAVARRWQEEGAQWLHVVDLDGAFSRSPKNREVIIAMVNAVSIPVQVGGGIRRLAIIEDYLTAGRRAGHPGHGGPARTATSGRGVSTLSPSGGPGD